MDQKGEMHLEVWCRCSLRGMRSILAVHWLAVYGGCLEVSVYGAVRILHTTANSINWLYYGHYVI